MAPITPNDLGGNADNARRVLVRARTIVPLLDTLEGEPRETAIAILRGALAEMPDPGERRLRRMNRNGTGVDLDAAGPMFTPEDEADLRSLFDAAQPVAAAPMGSFPVDDLFPQLWPGERYS